jgi:hypothetical protein
MKKSATTQRRSGGWLIRGLLALLATIGAAVSVAVLPAAALAASPAKVQIEPAEQTPTGFKLKAKVNPEGSATTYYFIYKQAGEVECEDLEGCGPETPKGGPLTVDTPQEVQAEVTGLTPATNYVYWLIARNAFSEDVRSASLGFTTPPPPPSIEGESVSHVTSTDATLEAQIDVEGLKHGADYQFQIVQSPSEYASELICPSTRPQGHEICVGPQSPGAAPIGFVPSDEAGPLKSSEVSLDLAGAGITLKPGTTYHYRVIAARAVQTEDTIQWEGPTVYGADQTFTTPSARTAPVIDSVSISHLTPTDATLEGQINSEGLSTMYEFQLTYTQCRECMSPTYNIPLPSGLLLGSFQDQSVSVDLNSVGVTLKPGFYGYSLSATSTGGSTEAPGGSFEPPPGVLDPPSPAVSTPSGGGQPAGSDTNSGVQPVGSASSSFSSTPGLQSPDILGAKTIKLEPFENAQKLSKALKLCEKKPKKQRSSCKRQAEKK